MARRTVLAGAALCAALTGASAQEKVFSDMDPPLYPEIVVPTDDSYSADAELTAFRQALAAASEARVETPEGRFYDPTAMLPFLADEVELFVGQGARARREEFVSIGRHPAARALEMAGRLSRRSDSADPVVQQRYGMHVLADLTLEPTVGATPRLAGRICTGSYGGITWPQWMSLQEKLGPIDREDWRIAAVVKRGQGDDIPPGGWPKRYQMVPLSPEQKRAGGWTGIIAPDGELAFFSTFFGPDPGYFAPYLNSHLCFEKRDGAWKVSAIAMRLD